MVVSDPVPVIQATLAPVFLVSGAGIFLNFLQARLFRVNDRLRQVAKDTDALEPGTHPEGRSGYLVALKRRVRIVRNAILFGVVTVLFTMITTILLIVPFFAQVTVPGSVPVATFTFGLASFAASLLLALQDTFMSVRMVEAEVSG